MSSTTHKALLPLFGRVFIAMIFVIAGFNKFTNYDAQVAYLATEGVPYPNILMAMGALMEIMGGLLVMLGFKARFGAFILFLFTIPATFIIHDFWTHEPMAAASHMQHFMKNFSIMGGLMYIMAYGAGSISFDHR